jgi:cytochrome c553
MRHCCLRAPPNWAAMPAVLWLIGCDVPTANGPAMQGTNGAARLAGQKARYTVWSLTRMRDGTRSHGTAAKPDPLLADLSNAEIESLAAHLASLR